MGWMAGSRMETAFGLRGDGLAVQTFGPRDDNCSVLKYANGDWDDCELTVRCRQTDGPTVSSGMQLLFRMGDDPGEGANVPGIGPGYMLSWAPTPTGYGSPDISLSTIEGFYEFSPGYYWFASGATLWSGRMEPDGQVFTVNNWIRVRVRAIGDVIAIMVDPDSNDPATDVESDFVLVGEVTDSSFSGGRIALNDHYAHSEWDYVYLDPMCDLCSPNGCDYTCLNWDGVTVTPEVAYAGEGATLSLSYEISGTPGHIIYVGFGGRRGVCAVLQRHAGSRGRCWECGRRWSWHRTTPGAYDVQIAVAHVYNAAEILQTRSHRARRIWRRSENCALPARRISTRMVV